VLQRGLKLCGVCCYGLTVNLEKVLRWCFKLTCLEVSGVCFD